MAKDYLAMIADIGESDEMECATSAKRVKSLTTPQRILSECRYGSLTFGAIRDRLVIMGASRAEAELVIGVAEELGQISKDEQGLFRVVH